MWLNAWHYIVNREIYCSMCFRVFRAFRGQCVTSAG